MYTSSALLVVDLAATVAGSLLVATGVAAPVGVTLITVGKVAGVANKALNVINYVDAGVAVASAGFDTYDAIKNNESPKEELKNLVFEVGINAAFIAAPKVLKSKPARKVGAVLSSSAKRLGGVAKKSIITLSKNKTFAKIIKITKDKTGVLTKSLSKCSNAKASTTKRSFKSAYLKKLISKSLIYKQLQQIMSKGAIQLTKKELNYLLKNADKANLKAIIKAYTGDANNFLEFFIRLSMGNKKQVAQILEQPQIRQYIDKAIRLSKGEGGYHEWLMTKNFKSFLLDDKWGEDGYFLAMALTKLVQKTSRVKFRKGGGHPTSGLANSSESVKFHQGLAEVIDKCNSKEELFIEIRVYAKKVLTEEAYKDFNMIFKEVLKTAS